MPAYEQGSVRPHPYLFQQSGRSETSQTKVTPQTLIARARGANSRHIDAISKRRMRIRFGLARRCACASRRDLEFWTQFHFRKPSRRCLARGVGRDRHLERRLRAIHARHGDSRQRTSRSFRRSRQSSSNLRARTSHRSQQCWRRRVRQQPSVILWPEPTAEQWVSQ